MNKKTGLQAFFLSAVLILIMGWATWDEHARGSEHAYTMFYDNVWFTLLWVLFATVACYYIMSVVLYKRLSVFLLHVAFLVILSGALITRLTGKTGQIHLRENHPPISSFVDDGTLREANFPFSLSLKSFEIEYYPGTTARADYASIVEVTDTRSGNRFEREISMNNILRYKNFRFYQSDFDEDMRGSVLSVSYDPWGISLSYLGYFLMFFSMLFVLFDKRERFRFLLKKLAQKPVLLALLLFIPFSGQAESLMTRDSLTLSPQSAERLGSLQVDYHGRICPVQTLANDFTAKLTGKTRYHDASGEQVFFGWLFFPEKWKKVPMFEIKSDELKKNIGTSGKACFEDFFDGRRYKLQSYLSGHGSARPQGAEKEALKLNDKIQLLYGMVVDGYLLNFFPLPDRNGQIHWYTPNTSLPENTSSADSLFVRRFLIDYKKTILENNATGAAELVDRLAAFQRTNVGTALPSDTRVTVERFYNRIDIFSLLFKICLTLGGVALLLFILGTAHNQTYPRAERIFYGLLWAVFIVATIGLAMRAYIGGRLPLSNGYETMLLLAWIGLLTGVLARRYSFLIAVFGFLLSGFTLLVARISSMDPQITPLMPVLQSPLLSIHVLTIMVSYGLCGFMALNSLTALIVRFFGGKRIDKTAYVERMKETCELFMFPATFLMGAGIFIGAIWANVSWGRYWGWDPKEVWALITFMLMSFTFHGKTLSWFRKPLFYHIFVLIIFLAVLMTYFGVNYILGGKHSYAG